MRGLERIVSKAFDSIADIEDKIVNSLYASKFAIRHPIVAGITGAAGLSGAIAYLYYNVMPFGVKLEADIYTLAILAAVAGAGYFIYDLARQHREVSDAGLPVEKFYEISGKKGNQRKAALLLAAVSLAVVNGYAYYNSGIPLETLARMDAVLVPAFYLSMRALTNVTKPISNAASFKAAIQEWGALLASTVTGKRQFHIKALESDARNLPSAQTKNELAEAYLKSGRLDDGLIMLKEAMEQKTDLLPLFMARVGRKKIESAAQAHKAIRLGKASHADYIEFSRSCQVIGEDGKAEESISQMFKKFPSIESDILAAMALETYGKTEGAAAHWNSAVSEILSKPGLNVLPVSERGVHNVRRYGPTPLIANTFIFRESEHYEEVEFEKIANSLLLNLLSTQSYRIVPKIVADFTHRNGSTKYELILLYLEGQSPAEMSRAGTLSQKHILSIIDYLAWIHQTVKSELSRKGGISLDAKLEQITGNPSLGLPDSLAKSIRANMGFIVEGQKFAHYVFAKDPHPANWRLGKDYLAALDWEDLGTTPVFIDSAKLYVHPDIAFTEDSLDFFHGEAAALYKDGIFSDDSQFRIRQLDAMLFQSLSFASAWSVPEMSHLSEKRGAVIGKTFPVFDLMRRNHYKTYSKNKSGYDDLENDFKRMHEFMAVK